jgi:hypothetical protein
MILGIGLYSVVIATITSYFIVSDPPTTAEDLRERLVLLDDLHQAGAVTDADYDAMRREIAARL